MGDIELVIKISEKAYNALTHNEFDANLVVDEMRKSIAHGTPLPKGHGRLIDAKQIVTEVECIWNSDGSCTTITIYDIDSTPTIIETDKERSDKE